MHREIEVDDNEVQERLESAEAGIAQLHGENGDGIDLLEGDPNKPGCFLMTYDFHEIFKWSDKNDANDVDGIAEASSRPSMRFVGLKSVAQPAPDEHQNV